MLYYFHHHLKEILSSSGGLLELLNPLICLFDIISLEFPITGYDHLLLCYVGASNLDIEVICGNIHGFRICEGIDSYYGSLTCMLSMLIDHSFILNPVPLVINLQRSKNASSAVHLLENLEDTLLDLVG